MDTNGRRLERFRLELRSSCWEPTFTPTNRRGESICPRGIMPLAEDRDTLEGHTALAFEYNRLMRQGTT